MKNNKIISILFLLIVSISITSFASVNEEIKKNKDKKDEFANKISKVREEIIKSNANLSSVEKEYYSLQKEITSLDYAIELTGQKIDKKEKLIKVKEEEVNIANVAVKNQKEKLRARIRTMYMFRKTGFMEVILKSDSVISMLTRMDQIQSIASYDKKLSTKLKNSKKKLQNAKKYLEEQKKELEDLKNEDLKAKKLVTVKLGRTEKLKKDLKAKKDSLEKEKRLFEAEQQQITAYIKKLEIQKAQREEELRKAALRKKAQKQNTNNVQNNAPIINYPKKYVGGAMGWPLPLNYNSLSSYFGPRYGIGVGNYHGAIDIPAPTGTPVYAAQSGVVIISAYMGSYGNLILIDHGGGLATAYAHNSVRIARVGQHVKKGQVVSRVGNTGVSYGSHLHFEVRRGGVRVDPLGYVNKP